MKQVFQYAGTLLITCVCLIPLFAQDLTTQPLLPNASFRLPPPKVQQLIWQTPAAGQSFTARDLLLAGNQQPGPVQFSWWKDINRLYEISPAAKALALGLAVGSAFTPYTNVPYNVQENMVRFYRQNALFTGKPLANSLFDSYPRWER